MPDPILPEPADFRPPRARRAGRPLSASARRRARRRRVLAFSAVGAIVLVGVGGGVALAATNDGGQRYRTATVERASVEQQIDSVGTIASAQRRDMAFSVAGTVGAVAVKVGDAVKAGQTLATLDPASLQDAIDSANSALATAQQQLSDDLASQTSSTSTSTSTSSSTTSSSTTSSSSARSSSSASSAADTSSASSGRTGTSTQGSSAAQDPAVTSAASAVHDAQQALLAQADKADVALKASSEAVTTSQTTCQALLDLTATSSSSSGSDPTPSPSPSPSESPSPSASPSASSGSSSGSDSSTIATALKACQDAIAAAQTAQKATSDAQAQLTALSGRLDQAVAAYQKALEQAARSSSTGTGQQGGASTPSTGSGTSTPSTGSSTSSSSSSGASRSSSPSASSAGGSFSGGGSTSSGPASAATILADRAAVTTAQANVEVATSKSDLATLTSPFAGTVAAVSMKVGDSVAASSSSEVITVIGTDGYTVTTSVPLSRIDIVKVGQDATVTTPSAKGSLAGKVTSIGVLDVSTTSDPAYQVQIALGGGDQPIYNGASAQVQISVAGASQVLTVPTSAVHVESGAATVDVLQNGKPVTVSVKRGAVGTDRTEITSGLKLGDQVVLADLQATIQSSSSSTNRGLSSLGGSQTSQFGGQFPGGGFGGGGFGGGGFTGGGFTGGGFGGQGGGKG